MQSNDSNESVATSIEPTADSYSRAYSNKADRLLYKLRNPDGAILLTVREFYEDRNIPEMIGIINDMTADWITNCDIEEDHKPDEIRLCRSYVKNSLFVINKVTEFILTLQEYADNLHGRERRQEYDALTKSYEEQISLLNQFAEGRERAIKLLHERVSLLSPKEQSELQD